MKKLLQKLVMKLYWKLQCNQLESFADQLCIYFIPKELSEKETTVIIFEIKEKINQWVEIQSCVFPEKKINKFNELTVDKK